MTDKELDDYKSEVEKIFGPCTILTSNSAGTMTNAEKTGDRDSYKGIDWIDYWFILERIYNLPKQRYKNV